MRKIGWMFVCLLFSFTDAIDTLKESSDGFCFFDIGFTEQELEDFQKFNIEKERFYHQFGDLENTERGITEFLSGMGMNDPELAKKAAARLAEVTQQVMEASGEETAWVHLRASVPTDRYDIPRWHFDGFYFTPKIRLERMLKFAVTLKGAPTLFYLMPTDLRPVAYRKMLDRKAMAEFCTEDNVVIPRLGEGAFLLAGWSENAAYHSEPPIHEQRLFFSITPCSQEHLPQLKKMILSVYPKEPK